VIQSCDSSTPTSWCSTRAPLNVTRSQLVYIGPRVVRSFDPARERSVAVPCPSTHRWDFKIAKRKTSSDVIVVSAPTPRSSGPLLQQATKVDRGLWTGGKAGSSPGLDLSVRALPLPSHKEAYILSPHSTPNPTNSASLQRHSHGSILEDSCPESRHDTLGQNSETLPENVIRQH